MCVLVYEKHRNNLPVLKYSVQYLTGIKCLHK